MCAIMRNPTVSSPSLRESAMCCSETSASVQCVATRMVATPQSFARCRCSTVPIPGSSSAETLARVSLGITPRRYSSSLCDGKP